MAVVKVNLHAELKQHQSGRQSRAGQESASTTKVQGKIMALRAQLDAQQAAYRQGLLSLQVLKVETEHQKHAMEQAKIRLLQNFRAWWAENKLQNKEHCEQVSSVPPERRNTRTLGHRSTTLSHNQQHHPSTTAKTPTTITASHQLNNLRRYANQLQLISNPTEGREEENRDKPNPGRALTRVVNTPTLMPSVPHEHSSFANEVCQRPRSCHGGRLSAQRNVKAAHAHHVSRERKNRPNSAGTVLDCVPVKDGLEELPRKLERYVTMPRDPGEKAHPYRGNRDRAPSGKSTKTDSLLRASSSGAKEELSTQIGHMRKVALTGDPEIDKEIIAFYEARNRVYQNK